MSVSRSNELGGLAGIVGGFAPLDNGLLIPVSYLPVVTVAKGGTGSSTVLAARTALGAAAMAYRAIVVADSPVAYWRLGETTGTNADDEVGANDGTYTGGYTLSQTGALAGDLDKAVLLNGTTGYVTVPDAAALDMGNAPFTIECWVKRTSYSAPAGYQMLYAKGTQGNLYYLNDKMVFDNNTSSIVTESTTTTDLNWHHWVLSRSGTGTGNTKLYKDGVDVTTEVNMGNTVASNATNARIGAYTDNTLLLNGTIDEVAIYGAALTAAQVLAHYQAGSAAGQFPVLDKGQAVPVAYLPLRTRRIPIAFDTPDASGNAYPALSLNNGFSNIRRVVPAFTKDVLGTWEGAIRVPADYVSGAKIICSFVANATANVFRSIVSTAVVAALVTEDTAYTAETAVDTTFATTALRRVDVSTTLTTTPVANATLNVKITHDGAHANDTLAVDCLLWECLFEYVSQ